MENNLMIVDGKLELLQEIQELWQKLNSHHMKGTEHFKEKYKQLSFEHRIQSLKDKAADGDIQVLIAYDQNSGRKIAYCVSTVNSEQSGEIDSLFVEEDYRGLGLGDMLMTQSLKWLESKAAKEIVLTVAGGNESVLDFYSKYGFHTTAVKLAKAQANSDHKAIRFKDYVISSDKAMLKLQDIVALLGKSYWASQRSKEKIKKSIENSLCFGVYDSDKQIAFARVITDYATFAYLCDVIVDEEYRGRGIGKAMVGYIMEYPELQDIKNICLITADAHKLYEKYGFANLDVPTKFMVKRKKGNI